MSITKSHIARVLSELARIYENPGTSTDAKLQALRLSLEGIKMRNPPKRKTDREKALLSALGVQPSGPKKKGEPKPAQIPENGKD